MKMIFKNVIVFSFTNLRLNHNFNDTFWWLLSRKRSVIKILLFSQNCSTTFWQFF